MAVSRRSRAANQRLRLTFRRASLGGPLKLVATRQGDLRAPKGDAPEVTDAPHAEPGDVGYVHLPVDPSDPVVVANRARIAELHERRYGVDSYYLSDLMHGSDRWWPLIVVALIAIGIAGSILFSPLLFAAIHSGILVIFIAILVSGTIEAAWGHRHKQTDHLVGIAQRPRLRSRSRHHDPET